MKYRRALQFLFVALIAASCGGGSNGHSATSPQGPDLLMDGAVQLTMIPVDTTGVLREVHLLLDGEVAHRATYSPPGSLFSFGFYDAAIKKGSHTLTVKVMNQSVATQLYDLSGLLIVHKQGAQKNIVIPSTQKTLRAGESIEFKFDATL